jgi:oxalate decarboxylase/phosphoglucose isomerase-like protein (cupin superfamily)
MRLKPGGIREMHWHKEARKDKPIIVAAQQ